VFFAAVALTSRSMPDTTDSELHKIHVHIIGWTESCSADAMFCRVLGQSGATGPPVVEKARYLGVVPVIVKRRMVYQHCHLGDGVEPGRVRAALPYLSAMPLWQEAGVCILREDADITAEELTVMYHLH
jgi:hypothetical protein